MGWMHAFFGWPDGGIWSNLLASLLWVPLALVGGALLARPHLRRIHARLDHLAHRRCDCGDTPEPPPA